jgi:hypothetical protein
MAVQTFGRRILGGIGAPASGAATAYGAGVTTGLQQREARQTMGIRDQEMAWKAEDRAEAKRAREAAAAAAAAARARGTAAIEAMGSAQPFFSPGVRPPTAGGAAPPAPRGTTRIPFPVGTTVPSAAVGPQASAAPEQFDPSQLRNIQFLQGELPAPAAPQGRPGDFAAQAAGLRVAEMAGAREAALAQNVPTQREIVGLGRVLARAQQDYQTDPTGENQRRLLDAQRNLQDANQRLAASQSGVAIAGQQYAARGPLDVEGPETSSAAAVTGRTIQATQPAVDQLVTIQGPNGPITVAAAPEGFALGTGAPAPDALAFGPITRPAGPTPELSFGPGATTPSTQGGLGFGERLGAAPTPTDMFFADIGRSPPGVVDLQALAADQNGLIFDPNFSRVAELQRSQFLYAAEVARANGDVAGFVAAQEKAREQETIILTQQLMLGTEEATNFNSGQRLSAVVSMVYGGRDVFIDPKPGGLGDVYIDGQLAQSDADLRGLSDRLLMMIDGQYRASVAAAQAEADKFRAEKTFETDEAIRLAEAEADVQRRRAFGEKVDELTAERIKADFIAAGLLPADPENLEVRDSPDGTTVLVIDPTSGDLVAAYAPVEELNPATGEPFITYRLQGN